MTALFNGGLRSLIPRRDVQDADDAVEELDKELEKKTKQEEEPTEKIVSVVSEDDEVLEAPAPEETVVAAPPKPLVTPLTFDDLEASGAVPEAPAPKKENKPAKKKAARKADVVPAAAVESAEDMWDKHEEEVQHILISDIHVNSSQPRRSFSKEAMAELSGSIEQHGILQPLVVRRSEKGYELIAGERRLRAAKSLGWERVPCVVRRGVETGASQLELALIENIQREDLNPVEEALAYRQLNEEYGMTHEEIGKRVGRSRVGITNAIRVLQLPDEVQQGIREGVIASGHAKAILMIPDKEKQVRFYRHMVAEGLTVRKAETRARRIQRTMQLDDPMREKRRGRSAFEIKNSGKLEDHFGFDARVRFLEAMNRFEIVFRTYSQEEVEELIGRLMGERALPKKVDRDVIEAHEDEEE
jgi:ParB family chromosome partitioning protein